MIGASVSSQRASVSSQQFSSFESEATKGPVNVMSVPLQTSERYKLTGENEVFCFACSLISCVRQLISWTRYNKSYR